MANTKITTNVISDDAVTSDKLGGDLTMPGHVSLADNKELRIGTGNDLVIKHDGSHTTLTNTTGNFTLLGDAVYIGNAANNEYLAQFIANGAASLRYDNTEELATVSGGVYIPNKLGIGTNNPAEVLEVYNATSPAIQLNDGGDYKAIMRLAGNDLELRSSSGNMEFYTGNADGDSSAERLRITSNGTFLLGTTTTRVMSGVGSKFFIEGTDYATSSIGVVINANGANDCPALFFGKSRGTSDGSNTIVQNGDRVFSMRMDGSDGTNLEQVAIIEAHVDAAPAANSIPGRMTFMTTNSGSQYATEKMRIDNAGNVGIGTTSPARKLEINTGGYNQLMIASNASANTNKLAGIESRNYSNYALGLIQMFANSSQTGLYHGSADSSAKGVTDHYFMTSPSKDSATNNTVMKLTSARNVEITDGDIYMASGHGINFGATSNAPGLAGLGTETLNDYEDGTWTPVLIAGTTNPTGGGAQSPSGRYTKIGNRVFVTFYVGRSWTNTPAGGIYISGLPYTIHASTNGFYTGAVASYNVGFGDGIFVSPQANTTTALFYGTSSGAGWGVLNWTTHTSGSVIYVSGEFSYHV